MVLDGNIEDILWFFAVFFFTVPPVMRFRENYLVPLLSTIMVFGFYTQAFWLPDFYAIGDWLWIGVICTFILAAYFFCGWFIHFYWLKYKSAYLVKFGAFFPLLKTWLNGKHYIINDQFIIEINRFRLFEVTWSDIAKIECEKNEKNQIILHIYDAISREKEEMNELSISNKDDDFTALSIKMQQKLPTLSKDWLKNAAGKQTLFSKKV